MQAAILWAGALTLAFLALTAAAPFGARAAAWADDLGTLLAGVAAAWLCRGAALRSQGRARWGWWLATGSLALWAFGNLVWAYEELVLRLPEDQLFPSLADVGFLGFAPLMLAALLAFAPSATTGLFRARAVVDALWTTAAVLLVSWTLVLADTLRQASGVSLADALAFLYPFADVLLASAALNLVVRADPALRRSHLALAGGVLLLAVADSGFAYFTVQGDYSTGAVTDAGWFAGLLVLCLAARLAGEPAPVAPPPVRPLAQVMSPYVAFLLGVLATAWRWGTTGVVDGPEIALLLATVLLLVVREALAHAELLLLGRRLQAALQAAEGAVASRDAVVRAVVHDLRNALTPIRLQASVIETQQGAAVARPIAMVKRNLQQADLLIDDLQDMAALESGRLQVEATAFDLAATVREVADEAQAAAKAAGLALALDVPAGPVQVRGDPRRSGQVLRNLVSNACKFTPAGGQVRIRVAVQDGMATVQVQDTGRGISAADLQRLFRPFERVGPLGPDAPKGTGLGLYISKGFMERQQGVLAAASPGEGQGSTFTMGLPVAPQSG